MKLLNLVKKLIHEDFHNIINENIQRTDGQFVSIVPTNETDIVVVGGRTVTDGMFKFQWNKNEIQFKNVSVNGTSLLQIKKDENGYIIDETGNYPVQRIFNNARLNKPGTETEYSILIKQNSKIKIDITVINILDQKEETISLNVNIGPKQFVSAYVIPKNKQIKKYTYDIKEMSPETISASTVTQPPNLSTRQKYLQTKALVIVESQDKYSVKSNGEQLHPEYRNYWYDDKNKLTSLYLTPGTTRYLTFDFSPTILDVDLNKISNGLNLGKIYYLKITPSQ